MTDTIYRTGEVEGANGKHKIGASSVDRREGEFLHRLAKGARASLEVGCANGLSSLFIASASEHHTAIDPFQRTQWDSAGLLNMQKLAAPFELIERRSEFALPALVEQGRSFDFIFIDGWHTFDHTLLDCFYATRLLSVGGVLAVDDIGQEPVRRAVDYLLKYPCYRFLDQVGEPATVSLKRKALRLLPTRLLAPRLRRRIETDFNASMIALEKISEDERDWDWYEEF
ncbi:MAG TPA: class I SAM-dependent methyltransferase [Pyrinomonadaceae bacterium]